MNNFLRIHSLDEEISQRVVFVRSRDEGGINSIYDPASEQWSYQVFIHNLLPYRTAESWLFESFSKARTFAAELFKSGWEVLEWDQKAKRPCSDGGHECGSGTCATCASTGGGCTTCGV